MPFHESGGLRYYTFDLFDRSGVTHGIFSRQGGVSPSPWASLNLGGTVGDSRENVIENRRRMFALYDRAVTTVFDSWQVHGRQVICADQPRPLDSPHQKADAILTDRPEITLLMRFADCVPIYLFDPVRKVAGLVHAGWRGTVDRVAEAAVLRMVDHYQSDPENILAGIGPSICLEHYPVGQEVVQAAQAAFGQQAGSVLWKKNGMTHFDLWQANQLVLETSGVRQIEHARQCTVCHNENWYSHRAEKGRTGRFGALIAL